MAKITRTTQKIFAGNANADQTAVFGSMKTGTGTYTKNIADLMGSTAFGQGFGDALVANYAPFMEEMNGINLATTQQLAYILQEGIAEYDAGTTYFKGSIVKTLDGTTPKFYSSAVDNNTGNALTDTTKWTSVFTSEKLVGQIVQLPCTPDYVPEGTLPCDGTEYTKAQFTDLWNNYLTATTPLLQTCSYADYATSISTYGQCAKFALDTVNNKFKVPTIKDGAVIQQAMSDTELGKAYNAGLPNITGNIFADVSVTGGVGALYPGNNPWGGETTGNSNNSLYFDASRSSSVYGNSTTVQMNAVSMRFFVVVANGSINQSQMDWSAWASGLAGKANTDLSNVTATGKATSVGWGMPDYSATISGVGNNYTAPKDGIYWFSLSNNIVGNDAVSIKINGISYTNVYNGYGKSGGYQIELSKNDTIIINNSTTSLDYSYFIPLKGV